MHLYDVTFNNKKKPHVIAVRKGNIVASQNNDVITVKTTLLSSKVRYLGLISRLKNNPHYILSVQIMSKLFYTFKTSREIEK